MPGSIDEPEKNDEIENETNIEENVTSLWLIIPFSHYLNLMKASYSKKNIEKINDQVEFVCFKEK